MSYKKMDKKLKGPWIKALLSGEYRQGRGSLLKQGAYCCLGVLAKVQGCSSDDLDWLDLKPSTMQKYMAGLNKRSMMQLVTLNDGGEGRLGLSFKQIAAWIRKNL